MKVEIKPITLFFEGGIKQNLEGFYFTVETEGREIELAAHEAHDCQLLYNVTDPKTGFSIVRNFMTVEAAITAAREKILTKGAAEYDAAVKKALDFLAANSLPELEK